MTKTVLLIDDDPAFLRWLETHLRQFGFKVLSATSGLGALELLKANMVRLVVTDMRMPLADGYDVVYSVKELYPRTPIIVTTANPINVRLQQALRFEGVALVRKPMDPGELESAIHALAPDLLTFPSAQSAA